MRKFPSINYPNKAQQLTNTGELVVQEKLDGANFRFTVTENGEPLFGSRNVVFKEDEKPLPVNEINKQFRHAVKYIQQHASLTSNLSEYTFYGEALHKHSIDYDAWTGKHPDPQMENPPNFVLFDVWDGDEWLNPSEVQRLADETNIQFVGVLDRIELPVDELNVDIPQSQFRHEDEDREKEFDRRGIAEGVVVKNTETGARTKIVHESFKEKKTSSESAAGQPNRFVEMYVTTARIEKIAHKLVDRGEFDELQMEMMEVLPAKVIEDVLSEEGWSIMCDENGIVLDEDTKGEIRSKTSRKCARTLQSMLQ